eukprot:NODE_27_length_39007_cov_1.590650.p6 type:complete len:560 gc:universal NODE_27_length_39007_cov_1.590650:6147-7826(+)
MKLNCSIFCSGLILNQIQMNRTFNDSKYFVDMPSKFCDHKLVEKFNKNMPWKSLFDLPGSDLIIHHKSEVSLANRTTFSDFVNSLDKKWDTLSRSTSENPWRLQTLINLPYPFIIPGGRFREMYYWDNYFIVKGLLKSSKRDPRHLYKAYGIIQNLLFMLKTYNMVPNGSRKYYLSRSQPPLLLWMINDYYEFTGNKTLVLESIPVLEKEFSFFHKSRMKEIVRNGEKVKVFHYDCDSKLPRPESYYEDYSLVSNSSVDKEQDLFRNIGAAAESGWDFSSRWFGTNFKDMFASDVIPVDLNYIMIKNYKLMVKFMKLQSLKYHSKINSYNSLLLMREKQFHSIFFDIKHSTWYDILPDGRKNRKFYASNLAPLWCLDVEDFMHHNINLGKILLSLEVFTTYQNGIPVSTQFTGQQWDFPNVWAPLQYWVVEGISKFNTTLAKKLAHKYIGNIYCIWKKTGQIFEKYNCCKNEKGRGGEYEVQEGFGFTNGVVLEFFDKYGPNDYCLLEDKNDEQSNEPAHKIAPLPRILMIFAESLALSGILYLLRMSRTQADFRLSAF